MTGWAPEPTKKKLNHISECSIRMKNLSAVPLSRNSISFRQIQAE